MYSGIAKAWAGITNVNANPNTMAGSDDIVLFTIARMPSMLYIYIGSSEFFKALL